MKHFTALDYDVSLVRRLLGSAESLVPDHLIKDALERFSVSGAVHYIRFALAGPSYAERKTTTKS